MTSAMRKTIKIHWIKTRNLAKKKIQSYLSTVRLLSGLYQKLYKGNESERRHLEQLKGHLDTLHLKMLRDQEVSQISEGAKISADRPPLKEVKNPSQGKSVS